MNGRRAFTLILSGVGAMGVFALAFANEWVVRFTARHDLTGNDLRLDGNGLGLGRLVAWSQFPLWRLTPRGSVKFLAVYDLSLILFLVIVALLCLAGVRSLDPRRGTVNVLILGWWATMVGAALAGLVRGVLVVVVSDFPPALAANAVWESAASGAIFGLFYGWLTGVAMSLAFLTTRPKETEDAAAPGPHGGAPGGVQGPPSQSPPPPLPQRVPQSSYSPQPPPGSWPSPRQRQPSWPAQPGPAGYPPPPAYGSPAPDADSGPPDRDGTAT